MNIGDYRLAFNIHFLGYYHIIMCNIIKNNNNK